MKPKHAGGRPSSYKPEYCAQVVELGREGASKAEMAHAIGVSRPTMDAWAAAHPEFLYAIKEALDLAQGWWESEGRKAVFGKTPGFNATGYIFQMKNRFPSDWKDRQAVEHSGVDGTPIQSTATITHKLDPDSMKVIADLVR